DIPEVSQVFNYAPPPNSDDYVHRIGRTGRAGRTGESFTIVSPGDSRLWDAVLKRIGKNVEPYVPEGLEDAVGEARGRGPAPARDRFDRDRGGRRRGGRGGDRSGPPRQASEPSPSAIAPPEETDLPGVEDHEAVAEAPLRESQDEPRHEGRSKRGKDRGRDRGRTRNGERRPGEPQGGDDHFKGMGDHVPAFLLRSLGKREDA